MEDIDIEWRYCKYGMVQGWLMLVVMCCLDFVGRVRKDNVKIDFRLL